MRICENCSTVLNHKEFVYDDREGNSFCDRKCYEEWAEDNYVIVVSFYYRLNCKETGR